MSLIYVKQGLLCVELLLLFFSTKVPSFIMMLDNSYTFVFTLTQKKENVIVSNSFRAFISFFIDKKRLQKLN